MKKLLILAAVLALAAPAVAVPTDPGPNGLGFYSDLGGVSNTASPAPYTPLNMYLLATNVTQNCGISGWEGYVLINPTSFPAGITFDIGPEALNVFTAPSFQVGFAVSRVGNPILLLTITTFYLGGPFYFGIAPGYPSSFNTGDPNVGYAPGYADGCDPGILIPFTPSSNTPWGAMPWYLSNPNVVMSKAYLLGTANATPPIATEKSTWGGVKDLYK